MYDAIYSFLEIAKVQSIGKVPSKDTKYVDIYRERPMKVAVKVLVPVREHPKVRTARPPCRFINHCLIKRLFKYSSISSGNCWGLKETP